MNKFHYLVFLLLAGFILLSNAGNPPNGNTGAPGEGTCSGCHTSGGSGGIDGQISINGLPSNILVNTAYSITVTVENFNTASKGGFQLVALDQNNNNVGMLSNAGPSSTISGGSRIYFEHNPALSFSGPGIVNYTVTWTSPNIAGGQIVTMYAASILSNGDGSSSGDLMRLDEATGSMPGPPALSAQISAFTNLKCNGAADGSISVTATNGLPPYTYLWSDGQTTATAIGLSAKMYSVTVSDNLNSNVVLGKLLTEPPAINVVSTGNKTLLCFGDKNGSITLNSSGGTGSHQYKWNFGATTKTIANLVAGDYTCTVSDANNCTVSNVYTITQPEAIQIDFKSILNPVCTKDSTGSCEVEINGGSQPYIYKWSSNENLNNIKNKRQGTYTVTITDKNGCSKTKSVTFIAKDTISPSFNLWKDTISFRCNLVAVEPKAIDNCGIKEIIRLEGIMPGDTFPIGITKMKYRAIDESNNSAEYTYKVTIINPIKLKVDTTIYDTCTGAINLLQVNMSNQAKLFYDLYFQKLKIKRYDTSFIFKSQMHEFTNNHIIIKDSFGCMVDTLIKFDTTQANFKLDSFKVTDASECRVSDGEIQLFLKGNVVSSFWINEKGDTIINSTGKNMTAGKYFYYASSGLKNDTSACVLKFGPFEIKCTTNNLNYDLSLIKVYPNPAKDQLIIQFDKSRRLKIKLYNLDGQLILENYIHNSGQAIDLSTISDGIYLIEINDNNKTVKRKLSILK